MLVLMTGATGFIGRALALRLRQRGHTVRAWVRNRPSAESKLGADIELTSAPFDEALVGCQAVVNLAGEPILGGRWTTQRRKAFEESRVTLTRELVEAMARAPKRPRVLVSASAVGFYGDRADEPLFEDSPMGASYLAELCGAWEDAANRARGLGVRVVTPRIGVVLGSEGGALGAMLVPFKLGVGGPIGSGAQFFPWIHLEDMVDLLVHALENDRVEGPMNAAAPEPVRQRDFARALGRALHRPAVLPVPALALRAVLGEAASVLLSSQRVQPKNAVSTGFRFKFPVLEVALADILGDLDTVRIESVEDAPQSPYFRGRRARYRLTQITELEAPIEEVFDFFSKAENLGAMTPPALAFQIKTPRPITMRTGARIDYRIGLGGVPMTWQTEIERWSPGEGFVDVQLTGPYHAWWHEHRFEQQGSKTIMFDSVYYSPPLGVLGVFAQHTFVGPALKRIFAHRAAATRLRFGSKRPMAVAA